MFNNRSTMFHYPLLPSRETRLGEYFSNPLGYSRELTDEVSKIINIKRNLSLLRAVGLVILSGGLATGAYFAHKRATIENDGTNEDEQFNNTMKMIGAGFGMLVAGLGSLASVGGSIYNFCVAARYGDDQVDNYPIEDLPSDLRRSVKNFLEFHQREEIGVNPDTKVGEVINLCRRLNTEGIEGEELYRLDISGPGRG